MATTVEISTVNSLVAAGVDYISAGDYDQAIVELTKAEAILAVIPDTESDNSQLEFDRESLPKTIANVRQLGNKSAGSSTGGLRRTSITYARVTD